MKIQEKYLLRSLELAKNGLGLTYPNPMVGCVIVVDDQIIGEGWHRKAGEGHAEVRAIESVENKELLNKATVYVSLEPCAHFGKTPPCSDLLISYKVPRVVIASVDPFKEVRGLGIQKLERAGIEVSYGFFPQQSFELNKRFFTYHLSKRPYITLKYAKSKDGFLDKIRGVNHLDDARPNWISNSLSKVHVHKFRAIEQAILVGKNTILNDNPGLTTRLWSGTDLLRVIVDRNLEIPLEYSIFNDNVPTLIFTEKSALVCGAMSEKVEYVVIDLSVDLNSFVLSYLFDLGVQSLIVEGGTQVLNSYLKQGLWDEIQEYTGASNFDSGIKLDYFEGSLKQSFLFRDTSFRIYKPLNNSVYESFLNTQETIEIGK